MIEVLYMSFLNVSFLDVLCSVSLAAFLVGGASIVLLVAFEIFIDVVHWFRSFRMSEKKEITAFRRSLLTKRIPVYCRGGII